MRRRRRRRCPYRSGSIRASADILPLFGSKSEEKARLFVVHDGGIAILFCVITMLGWGSWANTQKLSGKDRWPFELFYWDYAIGVLAFSLAFALTLGSAGASGMPFLENLRSAPQGAIWIAISSGVLFNIS